MSTTTGQRLLALAEVNVLLFDYSQVAFDSKLTLKTKIVLTCRKHQVSFSQNVGSHLIGLHGCSHCQKERKQTKRIDFSEFVRRSNEVHGDKYTYHADSYTTMNEPTFISCASHGNFAQVPYKHYGGQECPECSNESRRASLQKPAEGRALGEVSSIAVLNWDQANDLTPFDVSYKSNVVVKWKCNACSYRWADSPKATLNRLGCPGCGFGEEILELDSTDETFAAWAQIHRPDLLLEFSPANTVTVSDLPYRTSKRVLWRCSRNATHPDWTTSVKSRTVRGRGCRSCYESKGEQAVGAWLDDYGAAYTREFSPDTLRNPKTGRRLRYDFALEEEKILIEYDGIYHFKPVLGRKVSNSEEAIAQLANLQARDEVKNVWAKNNGWALHRITYLEDLHEKLGQIFAS